MVKVYVTNCSFRVGFFQPFVFFFSFSPKARVKVSTPRELIISLYTTAQFSVFLCDHEIVFEKIVNYNTWIVAFWICSLGKAAGIFLWLA